MTIALKDRLNFLHVSELKELTQKLGLADKGTKGELIHRIDHFASTGDKLQPQKFPPASYAKRGVVSQLTPEALILKGLYKNDLKTRLFFKKLIGEHFYFTAFGIDWINERWMTGSPPAYREFADMWRLEHQRRKEVRATPKAEWAYINFVQSYLHANPNSGREEINRAWESERAVHVNAVREFFASYL
jgi:hypothetical protein